MRAAETPISADEAVTLFSQFEGMEHIGLAVSGGADSHCLMHLAAAWAKGQANPPRLSVLTVDHGLRPEAAEETAQVCKWARDPGLDCHILRWQGKIPVSGIQARARDARYELMTGWVRRHGAQALVLAHNLEDQAETFIMRLKRRSGIDGLAGMSGSAWRDGVKLMRPLLGVSKSRLTATLEAAGKTWIEDPSNQDMRFERVRLRKLLARLEREEGIAPAQLAAAAGNFGKIKLSLERFTNELMAQTVDCQPAGYCIVSIAGLASAHKLIALRLLRRCLLSVGGQNYGPGSAALEKLFKNLIRGDGKSATLAGCHLFARKDQLWIVREMRRGGPAPMLLQPGDEGIWDNRFIVQAPQTGSKPFEVRALGGKQWAEIRSKLPEEKHLPAAAGKTLLSFWRNGHLCAVPHMSFVAPEYQSGMDGFRAIFVKDNSGVQH